MALQFDLEAPSGFVPALVERRKRRRMRRMGKPDLLKLDKLQAGDLIEAFRARRYETIEGYIRDRLFSAKTPNEVEQHVDDLLDDSEYHRLLNDLRSSLTLAETRRMAECNSPTDAIVDAAGEENRSLLQLGVRLEAAIARGYLKWSAVSAGEQKQQTPATPEAAARLRDPLGYLSEPALPTKVKQALLGRDRSELFALATGAVLERKAQAWLVKIMLDGWIRGAKAYLAFLAAVVPDFTVDAELLPLGERFDLHRVIEEHTQVENAYRKSLQQARSVDGASSPDGPSDA